MKALACLFLLVAGCSIGPSVPATCYPALGVCVKAYRDRNGNLTPSNWNALCSDDLETCHER